MINFIKLIKTDKQTCEQVVFFHAEIRLKHRSIFGKIYMLTFLLKVLDLVNIHSGLHTILNFRTIFRPVIENVHTSNIPQLFFV